MNIRNLFLIAFITLIVITGTILLYPRTEAQKQPLFKQEPKVERLEKPTRLEIPKLNINTSLEEVGLDKNNAMDVPKNVQNGGWYNLGFRPGELGNAVIAGHYDDRQGKPAVFYRLNELKTGDEVLVTDAKNVTKKFVVADIEKYPYNNFPIELVFGTFPIPRLNLITCTGNWDAQKQVYLERTVVFTRLDGI